MILHAPVINGARVRSRIEALGVPQELWFEFDQGGAEYLSAEIDPFVVGLLLLAMQRGEAMEVRAPLSRQLYVGLLRYQEIYAAWYPGRFKKIEIRPTAFRDESTFAPSVGTGAAFSGGVDSFFTLFQNRPQMTGLLFMAGFDMPLNLKSSIAALEQSFRRLAAEMKLDFVFGSTNIRAFTNSVDWTNAHGQALAASALILRKKWGKFLIPSSYLESKGGNEYPKWGTHPRLDPLLSTEAVTFLHHGENANRVQKLNEVCQHPQSHSRLRVCWIQDIGLRNCGECEKCIRTLIALKILRKLELFSTFSKGSLTRGKIRALTQRNYQSRLFSRELIFEAARRGQFQICFDLGLSLVKRAIARQFRARPSPQEGPSIRLRKPQ